MMYFSMYRYNFCWEVEDAARVGGQGLLVRVDPSDGGGVGRPCLVSHGVAIFSSYLADLELARTGFATFHVC